MASSKNNTKPVGATISIRLVVGGNAILAAGNAHVLVYANIHHQPVEIMLPPAERWQACVADDFPASYNEVLVAITDAGYRAVVSSEAAVSSSTGRG